MARDAENHNAYLLNYYLNLLNVYKNNFAFHSFLDKAVITHFLKRKSLISESDEIWREGGGMTKFSFPALTISSFRSALIPDTAQTQCYVWKKSDGICAQPCTRKQGCYILPSSGEVRASAHTSMGKSYERQLASSQKGQGKDSLNEGQSWFLGVSMTSCNVILPRWMMRYVKFPDNGKEKEIKQCLTFNWLHMTGYYRSEGPTCPNGIYTPMHRFI